MSPPCSHLLPQFFFFFFFSVLSEKMPLRAQLLQTMKENMTLMLLGKRKLWDPLRLLSISLRSV